MTDPGNPIESALTFVARARDRVDEARDRLDKSDNELRAAVSVLASAIGIISGAENTADTVVDFPRGDQRIPDNRK